MGEKKGVWIWFVVIAATAALGIWWIAASQNVDSATPGFFSRIFGGGSAATTTPEKPKINANTNTNAGSGAVDRRNAGVATVAASISGSGTFASWLSSTRVASEIKGKGPYTVFVPTNGSIGQLPAGTFTNLSAAEKKRFVEYHVISGKAIDVDAMTAGSMQALSRDALNFSFGVNKIPMVNSAIIVTQYNASNGVVYVIDNVLIPPKKTQ